MRLGLRLSGYRFVARQTANEDDLLSLDLFAGAVGGSSRWVALSNENQHAEQDEESLGISCWQRGQFIGGGLYHFGVRRLDAAFVGRLAVRNNREIVIHEFSVDRSVTKEYQSADKSPHSQKLSFASADQDDVFGRGTA